MKTSLAAVAVVAAGAIAGVAGCGASDSTQTEENVAQESSAVSGAVKEGERNFDRPLPTGNGRACETCHVEKDDFTLTPAHVEKRFQKLPRDEYGNPDFSADPLFNSIDADDFDHDFTRLRQGLARVTLTLAPNLTIDELPGARTVSLHRAVPSIENVAFTAPFLSDRRADTLQEQALGAAFDHVRPTTAPGQRFLDTVAAYELDQFSSGRVRKLAKGIANGTDPPRAEPDNLTAEEIQGREHFNFRCTQCHGTNTLNDGPVPQTVSRTPPVSVSRLNKANLPVYTWRFRNPDGTETVLKSPDAGRAILTGNPNPATDFEGFDIPTIYGVAKTAPYFHDNSSATLEAVMQHYQEDFAFAKSIGVPDPAVQTPMTDEEMRLIVLYMKRL